MTRIQVIGKAALGIAQAAVILYALFLGTTLVKLERESLYLNLQFDRALIEVLQAKAEEENSDGPDPNPPTAQEKL